MAALRFAARKLGGEPLQAPVAVVEELQRRLSPKFFHGCNGGSQFQRLAADERESLVRRLKEIHDKSEELYNLTAEVENNYSIPGKAGNQLRRLLRDLYVQVDPRHNDRELRWL